MKTKTLLAWLQATAAVSAPVVLLYTLAYLHQYVPKTDLCQFAFVVGTVFSVIGTTIGTIMVLKRVEPKL